MAKKPKILIVGGAGYVGGCLTDMLVSQEFQVTVYDNLTYEDRFCKEAPFIFGDIRHYKTLKKIANQFDIIIWLAALVGDGACAINPALTEEINVAPVRHMLTYYKGKVIYVSTCSVYGMNSRLLDESAEVKPLSHYAETKLKAEQLILAKRKNALVFRFGTLFGLGDCYARPRFDLLVNHWSGKAARGEPLTVLGGEQWRSFLHVKDAASALMFGVAHNLRGLYNVSGANSKIRDIAGIIKTVVPQIRIEYGNMKVNDMRSYRISSQKLRALGWSPRLTLTDGIAEVVRAAQEGRIKNPDAPLYSNADYLKSKVL